MQVGDLVKYRAHSTNAAFGVVLRTPEQTNNGDFEVCFFQTDYTDSDHTMFCRNDFLEVLSPCSASSRNKTSTPISN